MEIPSFTDLETKLSVFALKIAAVAFAALGLAAWILTLTHQRDAARLEVQRLNQVLVVYQDTARQAQQQLADWQKAAAARAGQAAALSLELKGSAPRTDEEARQWALKAAGRLR